MEISNLNGNNIKALENFIEGLKEQNPDIMLRTFAQDEISKGYDTSEEDDLITKVKEIEVQVLCLKELIRHIFDGHVLMNGRFVKI